MNIVVFANLKGGAGKTINAAHLAVALELLGCGPVGCIDLDPQATFTKWWRDRKHTDTPEFVKVEDFSQLEPKLKAMRKKFKWCVIDTPPQIAQINEEAIRCANLVIIPCKAGKGDMVASLDTVNICRSLNQDYFYLLNEVKTKKTAEAASTKLATKGKVAPVAMPALDGYWKAMWTGHTFNEQSKTTGALVINELAQFIIEQFEPAAQEEKAYA